MIRASIITPTTGSRQLLQCIESVQRQSYAALTHVVVVDGPKYQASVSEQMTKFSSPPKIPVFIQVLPANTGIPRYLGYRICVGYGFLVDADVIMFLDDDNWIDPEHVASCVSALEEFGADWAFALRKLVNENGDFLIDDDCDSIGYWRRDAAYRGPADQLHADFIEYYSAYPFLVDTSCYAIRQQTFLEMGHLLLGRDSFFASTLVKERVGGCTGSRTVNYRVRLSDEQRAKNYFEKGNASCVRRYCGHLPWKVRQRCHPIGKRSFLDAFPISQIRPMG